MGQYNLTDNVQESFNFVIRDKKYVMRYPRTVEVEAIQQLTAELQEATDDNNKELVETLSTKLENQLYGLITPEDHETPIKEALKSENIRVIRNFNTMIKTELSIS